MALYGDLPTVKSFLRANVSITLDADVDTRLSAIQTWVSVVLEERIGRTFGDGPVVAESVIIWARNSDILLLPKPARSIASVTVGGTVEGGTVTGGTAYDDALWGHWFVDEDGLIHALRLLSGGWWGAVTPVVVVGQFIDNDDDATVPDDLTQTANYLITETYKRRQSSAAGVQGLDGSIIPFVNAWNDELVTTTIRKYRVQPAVGLVV